MRKILLLHFLLLISFCIPALSQGQTVSGKVSDQKGSPIVGATVTVKETRVVTTTDASGNYSIQAAVGQTLVISHTGMIVREVKVASATQNVSMATATSSLDEVVVTAMDIKRSARSLTYSAQTVGGEEIKETQRENFITGLQGRVAGLSLVTTSGTAGASSSIVLRGFNSLSMSNQPLFVIDGVVISNETMDENSNGGSATGTIDRTGLTNNANRNSDYNNRISDINPNDIASVTILKGPEATALYGSQASSGAIIITTKKPTSNKLAVQYDNSFRITELTRFTETIDEYSNGTNGDTLDVFRYFGPKWADTTKLYDNKETFFKTGFAQTHNLGMDFGVGQSKFRFSTSYFKDQGVVPTNEYDKLNFRLANTTKISKWLSISPSLTYINTENNKVLRSAGGFMLGLLVWPSNVSIENYGTNSAKVPLFSANPNSDYDNPLFNVYNNKSRDKTDRFLGTLGVDLTPLPWLSFAGRFGYETFQTDGYTRYHPLSYYISSSLGGTQDNYYRKYNAYNHTITGTAKRKMGDFEGRLMIGTMWQDYETQQFAIAGNKYVDSVVNGVMYKNGQVITPQNYDQLVLSPADSNATDPGTRLRLNRNKFGQPNLSQLRQFAQFFEIGFNYKNAIFLNYSHRFEEASTLPSQNRKFNYPGGGISVIVSDLLPSIKSNLLSYWKVRTSLASTARLNTPYSTQSVFVDNLSNGGGYSYGFFNNSPDLEPEKQKTFEVGTEVSLFKNRVNLNATFYNTLNKDQIIENFRLSYGTGFVLNTQNAGSTRNQGVEFTLSANVVNTNSFTWNTTFNFNKMWNEVLELPANVSEYYLADTWVYANARGGLKKGGTTTTITAYDYKRNDAGQILINPASGFPISSGVFNFVGDRNPDFTLGWINNFTYKKLRLSMLWDFKVGGDVFNGTEHWLTTIGKSRTTADRNVPRVIEGILEDGLQNTATPTKNTIVVTPATNDLYYRNMPEAAFIQKDVNWARLRDLTLNYDLSSVVKGKIRGLKGLSAFTTVNNLILITNYYGVDPNMNANTAGTRGVGAFGFDYGTLPSPINVNLGFRANF
jgi:TonB-linked SusC/RagA family outer membrane protein